MYPAVLAIFWSLFAPDWQNVPLSGLFLVYLQVVKLEKGGISGKS